jgi:hypothetical protein
MVVTIFDPYPIETLWRNSIIDIDTPLHHLEYGIMSEIISNMVKNIRKNNRHNIVIKLIKNIHNDRLNEVWNNIIQDAKKLPNYNRKNWKISDSKKNKTARVKFFEKNDISLKYLEDALEIQNNGNPVFNPGDLVMFGREPCIIREKIKRGKYYMADMCKTEYVRTNTIDGIRYNPVPIWHRYRRINPCGGGPRLTKKVDGWKCVKIGVETKKIIKDRIDAIDRYNKELKKRKKFYKDIIRPLLEPDYCWSYHTFHNQNINVWKLTEPPRAPWNLAVNIHPYRLIRWNMEWEIIIDNIKNQSFPVATVAIATK